MAVLPEATRKDLWAKWMRQNDEPVAVNKADLRAAVDATDDWIEAQIPSFNAALPEPAKTNLTYRQKVRIFVALVQARFGVL